MEQLLTIAQNNPAVTLVVCIVLALILARIAAYFTTRKVSDNGLRYEYQIKRRS